MTSRRAPGPAGGRNGKPTIIDVADLASVHPSTVSRALNPQARGKVSAATVSRVLAAAERLGYHPNPLARGLKIGSTSTVGMLIPDLTNPLFPPIVRGIEDRLRRVGWTLLLTNTDNDTDKERELLLTMLSRHVDGLILATARLDYPLLDDVADAGLPVVLVNRSSERTSVSAVTADDHAGVGDAVRHLVSLGHRAIAFVGGPRELSTGRNRHRAFVSAMHGEGLEPDPRLVCFSTSFQEERSHDAFEELLARDVAFTAVVCGNDLMALGGYDVLGRHGLRIPADVSVVGYNGIPFSDRFTPALTTVQVPQYHIGVTAAELLLELTVSRDRPPRAVALRPELVVRASTGSPPAISNRL